MTSDLNHDLAALVETLTTEADAHRRERALLEAAECGTGAIAVALWREVRGTWTCVAQRGDVAALPSARDVTAVLAGDLSALLPAFGAVAHVGGRALVVGGLGPATEGEDVIDMLDALLLTAALASEETAAEDLPDLVLPALPSCGQGVDGTHAPPATDLAELRHLLSRLRSTQELLARGDALEPLDRDRFTLALDQGFEQAGDLLLTRLGKGRPTVAGDATLGPVWSAALATEEAAARLAGVDLSIELDEGALELPLAVTGADLLALVLLALEVGLDGGSARVFARIARAGENGYVHPGVALRVESRDLVCNPPGESSYAQLRTRAEANGARVAVEERALELWLPARARGLAA